MQDGIELTDRTRGRGQGASSPLALTLPDLTVRGYPSALNRAGRIFGAETQAGLGYLERASTEAGSCPTAGSGSRTSSSTPSSATEPGERPAPGVPRGHRRRIGRRDHARSQRGLQVPRPQRPLDDPDMGNLAVHDYADPTTRPKPGRRPLEHYQEGFRLASPQGTSARPALRRSCRSSAEFEKISSGFPTR